MISKFDILIYFLGIVISFTMKEKYHLLQLDAESNSEKCYYKRNILTWDKEPEKKKRNVLPNKNLPGEQRTY